jgi:hypothetical protein
MDPTSEEMQRGAAAIYLLFCAACGVAGCGYMISRLITGFRESCPKCRRWWAAVEVDEEVIRKTRRHGVRTRWHAIDTLRKDMEGKLRAH